MARIVNSRCVLAVRDLKVSTRYYKEVLGFSQDPIDADGWSFLTRDTFRVMLGECANEKPASELGDHSYFAYWNVDDVDGFYREIVDRRALVTSEPTNRPWGLREFGLHTPDGHRITCGELIQVPAIVTGNAEVFTEGHQQSTASADWPRRSHSDGTTSAPTDQRQRRYARCKDRPASLSP